MPTVVKMEVSPETVIRAVKRMKKFVRQVLLEDLIAATSPSKHSRSMARFEGRPSKISWGGVWPVKYRLVYTHRAIRDIDAFDKNVKQRIGKTLLRYEPDPLKHAEPLKQSELGSYRVRIAAA